MTRSRPREPRARQAGGPAVRVAVAHYPEGAGHATRMLAVGQALERRGAEIVVAGGGPGTEFVEANGYDCLEPTVVDFIDAFQQGGSLRQVLTRSVPRSGSRVADFVGWLRAEAPSLLVTDDTLAAVAAAITQTPLYFVTHDAPGLYERRVETGITALLMEFRRRASRAVFYPTVWEPHPIDPQGVERTPPLALAGDQGTVAAEAIDVLVVPSQYSRGVPALAEALTADGFRTRLVGGDRWEPVPSIVPVMRAADVVVCSGYSSVMEAAVARTPCIVYPFTAEQRGVARVIDAHVDEGFAVARDPAAVRAAVAAPPAAPDYDNGAGVVAERVLADRRTGMIRDGRPGPPTSGATETPNG